MPHPVPNPNDFEWTDVWATPAAPAGDDFPGITVSGSVVNTTGDNTTATFQGGAGETRPFGSGTKSLWWTWVAINSSSTQIDTIGSSFDTVLAVYTGAALGALTTIASDDDSGGGATSKVIFAATAGVTYRIQVIGFNDSAFGSVHLNISNP